MSDNICEMWLVSDNKKPYIFTPQKSRAESIFKSLSSIKGSVLKLEKVVQSKKRVKEIGKNLFERKKTFSSRDDLIAYRNFVIQKWRMRVDEIESADPVLVWRKLYQKDEFLNKFDSAEEFSQWCLDYLSYINFSD